MNGVLISRTPDAWAAWEAPNNGLHDFHRTGHALEVKTSLGPVSKIQISTIDQLETDGLRRLDLLHVRLIETQEGKSIDGLVSEISNRMPDELSRRSFENALLRRGLMPDEVVARARPHVQLRSLDAYKIDGAFPRITRPSVSIAVVDATYTLNLQAIAANSTDSGIVLDNFCERTAA